MMQQRAKTQFFMYTVSLLCFGAVQSAPPVGLPQGKNSCFYNAVAQLLYRIPPVRNYLLEQKAQEGTGTPGCSGILHNLKTLFGKMKNAQENGKKELTQTEFDAAFHDICNKVERLEEGKYNNAAMLFENCFTCLPQAIHTMFTITYSSYIEAKTGELEYVGEEEEIGSTPLGQQLRGNDVCYIANELSTIKTLPQYLEFIGNLRKEQLTKPLQFRMCGATFTCIGSLVYEDRAGGHWTAYIKDAEDNQWYYCDSLSAHLVKNVSKNAVQNAFEEGLGIFIYKNENPWVIPAVERLRTALERIADHVS